MKGGDTTSARKEGPSADEGLWLDDVRPVPARFGVHACPEPVRERRGQFSGSLARHGFAALTGIEPGEEPGSGEKGRHAQRKCRQVNAPIAHPVDSARRRAVPALVDGRGYVPLTRYVLQ